MKINSDNPMTEGAKTKQKYTVRIPSTADKTAATDDEAMASILRLKKSMGKKFPQYIIFINSCTEVETLLSVIARIPSAVYELVQEILIFDDGFLGPASTGIRRVRQGERASKVSIFHNPRIYGYGGNQKLAFEYCISKGYDFVINLPADGSCPPENLSQLILPTLTRKCEIVFGSCRLSSDRRSGSVFRWTIFSFLHSLMNGLLTVRLLEWDGRFRLYSIGYLQKIKFALNADDELFDAQMIIQAYRLQQPIHEVPIAGMRRKWLPFTSEFSLALRALWSVIDFRLHELGITSKERYNPILPVHYTLKDFPHSSHRFIIDAIQPDSVVLDLGCGDGSVAREIRLKGCQVTGVDLQSGKTVARYFDRYVQWNLEQDRDLPLRRIYDYVILGDIVEHIVDGIGLMMRVRKVLKENGQLIISTPNVALWLFRLKLFAGRFEYADKGIMDRTHVHFYTRSSLISLLKLTGFQPLKKHSTGLPFPLIITTRRFRWLPSWLNHFYYFFARIWPKMFAYQFVILAQITRLEWHEMKKLPVRYHDRHPHLRGSRYRQPRLSGKEPQR